MSRVAADKTVFTAIADPTRRAILELLRDGERSVGALRAAADEMVGPSTPSAFSQHLAVLRRAGLVAQRKAGRQRVYSVEAEPLRELSRWIAHFDTFWTERLDNPGVHLDKKFGGASGGERKDER